MLLRLLPPSLQLLWSSVLSDTQAPHTAINKTKAENLSTNMTWNTIWYSLNDFTTLLRAGTETSLPLLLKHSKKIQEHPIITGAWNSDHFHGVFKQRPWDIRIQLCHLPSVLFTYLEHQVLEEEWKDQRRLEVGGQNPQSAHPSFSQLEVVEGKNGINREKRKAENIK